MQKEKIVPSILDSTIRIFDGREENKNDLECDWHFHNEYELIYIRQGEKIFYTKGRSLNITEGDVVFVNRRVPHKTKTPAGYCGTLLQFNEGYSFESGCLTGLLPADKAVVVLKKGTEANLQIRSLFEKISDEYRKEEKGYELYIKSYVSLLSACLYRFGITENKRDSNELKAVERVLPALRYISENYSKQITLEEVSCILSVDKAHFCRLFKKAMNVSFTDYLNFVRLNHAEELLRKTDMSVSEIAYEVGILSSSYFAEIFKKFNSITPTQYRKMSVDM